MRFFSPCAACTSLCVRTFGRNVSVTILKERVRMSLSPTSNNVSRSILVGAIYICFALFAGLWNRAEGRDCVARGQRWPCRGVVETRLANRDPLTSPIAPHLTLARYILNCLIFTSRNSRYKYTINVIMYNKWIKIYI